MEDQKEFKCSGGTICTETIAEDGSRTLSLTLKNGKVVVVRELLAEEIKQATRLTDGDEYKSVFAIISLSATFDGQSMLMEDLQKMKMKEFNRIADVNAELNF